MSFNHLDLFSGIGGFALAAKWAGFNTKAFCEIDPFCKKVLEKNFPNTIIFNDIKTLQYTSEINLVTAGFPCQPFSQAGSKKGTDDSRYLWKELLKVITNVKAEFVILENVSGLIKMELDNIITNLEREDYQTESFIIPACATNAPHRRDRIWIIAYSNSLRINEWFCDRETGYFQEDLNGYVEKIQQEWTQFIPNTWSSYKARDWLNYNTESSRRNDGIPERLDKDRIKSLGNAIVPQVIYPILKLINIYLSKELLEYGQKR